MTRIDVPQPGFGTVGHDGEACVENVVRALEAGYRHVDTAQMYDNERSIGEAIDRAPVDREDVFLATKVHPENLARDDVIATTEESLERLGVDRVDLLYVHWPTGAYDPESTLPAIDEVRDRGWTRHVAVSNFDVSHLDEAQAILDAPIAAHQIECHPWLRQDELVAWGRENDVVTVAYSPIARGRVLEDDLFRELAEAHDATPVQVALSWHHGRDGVVATPKATGDHVEENLAAGDLALDAEAVERIESIEERVRLIDREGSVWAK